MFSYQDYQIDYDVHIISERDQSNHVNLFSESSYDFEINQFNSDQNIGPSNDLGTYDQEVPHTDYPYPFNEQDLLQQNILGFSLNGLFQNNLEPHEPDVNSTDPQPSENLISIPCYARTDEAKDINNQHPDLTFHKRKRKRIVDLSETEKEFKYDLYKFFTQRKKFSKIYVIKIHKMMMKKLHFPPITREETRQIDLYFKHYADAKKDIFDYIKENKEKIQLEVFNS